MKKYITIHSKQPLHHYERKIIHYTHTVSSKYPANSIPTSKVWRRSRSKPVTLSGKSKAYGRILPLKIGYNFHITERFCLMPSIGLYAAYGFSAGSSSLEIVQPDGEGARTETHQWNPMKGYSYPIEGSPNNAHALLTPFRHWEYGGTAGLKAIIAEHYTVSFNYMVGIKQVHDLLGLRNSNFQLNIGYRF